VVSDKDLDLIVSLLPKNATYYFCKPNVQRGLDEDLLKEYFFDKGFTGNSYSSVNEALHAAKLNADTDDLIYVGGSTFVVAEVL
jgi:dihydrofolate synthase/folylpolyglutamate synthase